MKDKEFVVEKIRSQYMEAEHTELDELKALDARVRKPALPEIDVEQLRKLHAIPAQKARAASLSVGIVGALILGTGMSLILTELGAALGEFAMILGIVVGLAGMIPVVLAYPVYSKTIQRERKKIAPEILRLTEELL